MTAHIQPGSKLGRYEIRSHIGAGGMGDVYLARDTELDRSVALKVLPPSVATDQQRMRRFVQEAKAASSLNHQNIITIYEIGETDSTRFIATEFVDGVTLRQQLRRGRLTVPEILNIAIQIATGLAAAHEAGIIHRDIKPENVMLRNRDGFVKLLDFGLVKLTEVSTTTTDTEAPTRALVNTDAGTVMGTVTYMSPEQARGKTVDERTDIWSLGVILYEMTTGIVPFGGETSADVIAAIVKTDPAPVSRLAPDVPAKLEEIVAKALEKDRDERYQTTKDLLVDLRRLKKRLDFESESERSTAPDQTQSIHSTPTAGQPSTLDSVRPTSSAEYIVSEIKRHKTGVILAVIAIPLLIGAAFFMWSKFATPATPAAPPAMKITKLTSGGRVNGLPIDGSTSISPDGKYVVFTLNEAGKISMWVRQISTGSDVQILPASDLRNNGTTISNDNEYVYYVGMVRGNPSGTLYQIPILGGTPRKVIQGVLSPVSFSPDGSQFAFMREDERQASSLVIANTDGSGERTLAVRKGNDWFAPHGPAWSPDGRFVASGVGSDTGGSHMTVVAYSVADGSEKPITSHKWRGDVRRLLWLKDGSGLVLPVLESANGAQLWFISQPDGAVRRLTNDLNGYGSVSFGVSGDSKTIVTVQSKPSYQIWTTTLGESAQQAVQITHGETDGMAGLDWTPDGEIVYFTNTGETNDLLRIKSDGTNARTLTEDPKGPGNPSVSPDGKFVYFESVRSGLPHVWRVSADGLDLKQFTSGDFSNFAATVSPDGRWVFFLSWRTGLQALWKMPTEGGEAIQVTDKPIGRVAFSPDGRFLAGAQIAPGTTAWQIAIIPVDGSAAVKWIVQPAHINLGSSLSWSPDSRAVFAKSDQGGVGNIWSFPIDGSTPKPVTSFTSNSISNFAISRDGKRLAVSRGYSNLDVVLIKDFR
ncbi:MAG TPA: protein kinase [Pyrinomonadaceae bacterium]|nr:protein kinase [Pyrinomonadaceae bacterium]